MSITQTATGTSVRDASASTRSAILFAKASKSMVGVLSIRGATHCRCRGRANRHAAFRWLNRTMKSDTGWSVGPTFMLVGSASGFSRDESLEVVNAAPVPGHWLRRVVSSEWARLGNRYVVVLIFTTTSPGIHRCMAMLARGCDDGNRDLASDHPARRARRIVRQE